VWLHGLRHFTATQLLGAGVPSKAVADRLGHTRVSTTTDRYASSVPEADRAAAAAIAGVLRRRG
jgi:integrase